MCRVEHAQLLAKCADPNNLSLLGCSAGCQPTGNPSAALYAILPTRHEQLSLSLSLSVDAGGPLDPSGFTAQRVEALHNQIAQVCLLTQLSDCNVQFTHF